MDVTLKEMQNKGYFANYSNESFKRTKRRLKQEWNESNNTTTSNVTEYGTTAIALHRTNATRLEELNNEPMEKDKQDNGIELGNKEVHKLKAMLNQAKETISALKDENEVLLKNSLTAENMLNTLKENIKNIPQNNIHINMPVSSVTKNKTGLNNILLFSDLHYGETVNPLNINNINEYNLTIAKERVIKLFTENLKNCKYHGASNFYLMMMGDMLSGVIHDELLETNQDVIANLILDLYHFLTELIEDYAKNFDKVEIHCVSGNHGRITQDYKFKNKAQNNFEYIMYKFIEDYFKNKKMNVMVSVSESDSKLVTIQQLKILVEHGDSHKGGNGFNLMPYNTLARDVQKDVSIFQRMGIDYDIQVLGHFHVAGQAYTAGDKLIIFNPSIVGANEYSLGKLHSAFPASQYSLITDEKELKYTRLIRLN